MKKQLIASTLALLAVPAFAEVKLNVDENIKVIAINGQEIKHGLLQPLQKQFTLQAGQHMITARYDRLFNLRNQDHDYLKSDNISLAVELADNQTYELVMPNQPNSYQAAKEYAKSPVLAVAHNGKIIAEQAKTDSRTGVFASMGASLNGLLGRNQPAVIASQPQATSTPTPATPEVAPKGSLDNFMQLWLDASEAEREKIRQWVKQ